MFEPYVIGNVRLKNRIIMAPVADYMMDTTEGPSEQQVAYFAERAKGGVGLICQNSYISTLHDHICTRLDSDKKTYRHSYLTQAVHNNGAKMALMLSIGRGRLAKEYTGKPNKSPTPYPYWDGSEGESIAYTNEEVYQVIEEVSDAAARARQAEYDFVMLQGYGGYGIDQFMDSRWNQREDEFGGSFEKRMLFPKLLIEGIHKKAGDDFPIIFKMTPTHMYPGGRTIEEGIKIAKCLESYGVAALQIDVGCHEIWHYQIEPVYHQERVKQFYYAKIIKENVSIPVYTQGKVGNPEEAEAVFEEGYTDFVTVGRSFVADPQWANKIKNDRVEDIVPCICCMEGCMGRIDKGKTLSCALNPSCGCEEVVRLVPAEEQKKIIVVGAGPGGIEAALTASKRGYKVELWEKHTYIGGLLNQASAPANKREFVRLLDYYKAQIYKNSNIRLRLNRTATSETLLEAKPDAVILAVGGIPIVPKIPGTERENVHLATDVLLDKKRYGKKIVIIGAGFVGCETAMHMDYYGKDVVLIEMKDQILPDSTKSPLQVTMMLKEIIAKGNIDVRTKTKLVAIQDEGVVVEYEGCQEKIDCDDVVLALGFHPNLSLEEELKGKVEVITIGDAVKAGKILNAVWQGYGAAISI